MLCMRNWKIIVSVAVFSSTVGCHKRLNFSLGIASLHIAERLELVCELPLALLVNDVPEGCSRDSYT